MIINIHDHKPIIHKTCFITQNVTLIGRVELKEKVNVWFNAVIRGDVNKITVGKYTNIQDGCMLHVSDEHDLQIGNYVTVGHNSTLHGCVIHDNVLVGMGSIVLDGAEIGKNSWIAAGTVIPPGKKIPENSLVMGNPFVIKRQVTEVETKKSMKNCKKYAEIYPTLYTNN